MLGRWEPQPMAEGHTQEGQRRKAQHPHDLLGMEPGCSGVLGSPKGPLEGHIAEA